MENFSNNREDYWNQIKKELLDTKDAKDFRFQYLEMGQLLSHGFSVTMTKKSPQQLILKIWNAEFDNNRFNKGIFNLDRLAITDCKIELNLQEVKTINVLLNKKLGLTNRGGMVLDGVLCQFEVDGEKIQWTANEEINDDLARLVKLLRNKRQQ